MIKKYCTPLVYIALFITSFYTNLYAQNNTVDKTISVFPYQQKAAAKVAIDQMNSWGKKDWTYFIELLNDDSLKTKSSYALAAFVHEATLLQENKKHAAIMLTGAYKHATTFYAKEIIIKHLGLLGDDAAIKVLAKLLKDPTFVGNASRALASIHSEKALATLKNALDHADALAAPHLKAALENANFILPEIKNNSTKSIVQKNNAKQLLQLKDAYQNASNYIQKKNILSKAEHLQSIGAFFFISKALQDVMVQQDAALILTRLALTNTDINGPAVSVVLEKAITLIHGEDSAILVNKLSKHLKKMPYDYGFVNLFNGNDLTGWKGLVTNPIARSKMTDSALQAAQQVVNGKMKNDWVVKDGLLVFTGHGDNLCTEKKYGDIEMFVDWKITEKGDAGIYLRGSPQVQIWDTSRREVGAQVGSGGLYNNQKNISKPLVVADHKIGEWNTFHIIMKGDKVTVYLNGILVTDNIALENYWDRAIPIFSKEQIELQAHGTYVAYRDIFLRELPTDVMTPLSESEKQQGFISLYDGSNNLDQWIGNKAGYICKNGSIEVNPEVGGGNLYTKDEFDNFVYRFEFQLTPGANNGIGIRAPLEGDAAYVGMEIQVLDNEASIYQSLQPYQYHGSVYGVIPSKRGFLKPTGEWNQEEIEIKGTKIKVTLNGTVILQGDIKEASANGTMDHKQHPGLTRTTGHIGFLGHGDVVRFKNIRIKKI